jgi:imidazolonepropionase-like amidohydrolase
MVPAMTTVYRHAAVADGTGPDLQLDQSLIVSDGVITWMGHDDVMPAPPADARVIDAGGATIVPGMVDAHSHTVLPGGSHWIARIDDPTDELARVAEENGELAHRAGTRWFRDVGSPRRDGSALALRVREAWKGRRDRPYVRAAGTWIARSGVLPPTVDIEANDADELVAAVEGQADDGADLIKLYMDGPDPDTSPWTADEVARAVAAAAARDLTVTAHAGTLPGTREAVRGGVDCIEHGFAIDAALADEMVERGTFLVSTLAVFSSWETFGSTTTIDRFADADRRTAIAARKETAYESLRLAAAAGVQIAAGTDFGGGSLRANQLAWEVEAQVSAGREPYQALASATRVGGDLLREPTAGRLSVGGPADFFLVHGNPLDDPSALWRVWRAD